MSHNKLVIIDQMMSQLDAARPGIVPGSVVQAVVSGIQNTPSNIVQANISGSSSSSYTTFPISPIIKNCCLDKTYLNLEFDINFKFNFTSETALGASEVLEIPLFFGLRDTSNLFDRIQILIENAQIWSTVYHREESTLAYCSLPETEIRGNNQYSSIEKMKSGARSPMKRIIIKAPYASMDNTNHTKAEIDVELHFKATVDINRLTPLISNLHYTTPHFGNLRLKVFMNEIQKAFFFCPDYSYYTPSIIADTTAAGSLTGANVSELINKASAQPIQNQYWQFYPLSYFLGKTINPSASNFAASKKQIPFYGYVNVNGIYIASYQLYNISFSNHSTKPFFTFNESSCIAEIVQTCFDIEEGEYQRLTDYFANIGSIIIPSQVWSTSPFNNSMTSAGSNYPSSSIGNVAGYNINFASVFSTPSSSPCCFCPEFFTNMQLILEGRPINALPYQFINDKAIVDSTQAIIDTDHEEINRDYMNSLNFLNETDDIKYLSDTPAHLYGNGTLESSIRKNGLYNSNLYCINFSTNLPDAFHSGASTLEKATTNALIRLDTQSALDNSTIFTNTDEFPMIISHKITNTVNYFASLCDCCIVLDYDAARGTCFNGSMSWAAPYAD